jgi:hypothetical protein
LILLFRHSKIHAEMRYRIDSLDERNAVVERLREFIRLNYVTGADVAWYNRWQVERVSTAIQRHDANERQNAVESE